MRRPVSLLAASLASVLVTAGLAVSAPSASAAPSSAATDPAERAAAPAAVATKATKGKKTGAQQVASREIVFDLVNSPYGLLASLLPCQATRQRHAVTATLIGPRKVVRGRGGVETANVLVHDAGTGAWFWNLRKVPSVDYATKLAQRGHTSIVLDRLGYDRSRLSNGNRTCLEAQVHMLNQVVQHLKGGKFEYRDGRGGSTQHFAHVVLHGHGTGALMAKLEAARFDDVAGLVLMSTPASNPTGEAVSLLAQQTRACARSTFAPFGESAAAFRKLLFSSATAKVQRLAAAKRNPTPCGDVATTLGALVGGLLPDGKVPGDVPVLELAGGRDVLYPKSRGAVAPRATTKVFAGSGSALPLERDAAAVRAAVLRFLRSL